MSQALTISTRHALWNAAIEEFWEHGFRGASVRAICARAGASANAITYHFGSKENLYREILDDFADIQNAVTAETLNTPADSYEEFVVRLEVFLGRILETYYQHRKTVMIVIREFERLGAHTDDNVIKGLLMISSSVSDYVQAAQKAGFVRPDVDTDIFAGTVIDRVINQARFADAQSRFFKVATIDPEYRRYWLRASLDLLVHGAMTPQGRDQSNKTGGRNASGKHD